MSWIQCKCSQNLERNASARRVALIGKKYPITGSVVKNDNMYSLHVTGASMCSNKLEGVAFVSSRNFTKESTP